MSATSYKLLHKCLGNKFLLFFESLLLLILTELNTLYLLGTPYFGMGTQSNKKYFVHIRCIISEFPIYSGCNWVSATSEAAARYHAQRRVSNHFNVSFSSVRVWVLGGG